jgi:hypothetical protein
MIENGRGLRIRKDEGGGEGMTRADNKGGNEDS